jgi:starch synthase
MRAVIGYDPALAHRIYAGCDMLLMPSLFEPCGLSQLIGLRYGAIPLVRKTGGLADTIQNYLPRKGTGYGFVFTKYSSAALLAAIKKASDVFSNSDRWESLVLKAMSQDFSWDRSAEKYVKLYQKAAKK